MGCLFFSSLFYNVNLFLANNCLVVLYDVYQFCLQLMCKSIMGMTNHVCGMLLILLMGNWRMSFSVSDFLRLKVFIFLLDLLLFSWSSGVSWLRLSSFMLCCNFFGYLPFKIWMEVSLEFPNSHVSWCNWNDERTWYYFGCVFCLLGWLHRILCWFFLHDDAFADLHVWIHFSNWEHFRWDMDTAIGGCLASLPSAHLVDPVWLMDLALLDSKHKTDILKSVIQLNITQNALWAINLSDWTHFVLECIRCT